MDSAITQTIAFFGAIAVALILAFGGIITAFEVARYRRAATLAPLQQAATDTQLNFLADKMAPVIGGWASTQDKLEKAIKDLDVANTKLAASESAIHLLKQSIDSERDTTRKLDKERDQQLGKLDALIIAKDAQIDMLTATVARMETELNKVNEQLRVANEQLTRVLHGQQAALPGGHTEASRITHAEDQRKDAAAFAGPSEPTPVIEAAIAPPGGLS